MHKTIVLREQIGVDKVVFTFIPFWILDKDLFNSRGNVKYKKGEENPVKFYISGNDFILERTTIGKKEEYRTKLTVWICDKLVGNLQNCTMSELLQKLNQINNLLQQEYGLCLDISELRLSYMEISTTFAIKYPFEDYWHLLNIVAESKAFRNMLRNVGWTKRKKRSLQIKNKQWGCRIYSKSNHLVSKKGNNKCKIVSISKELLRVEYMFCKGKKIRTIFGTNKLCEIDDALLCKVYGDLISKYYFMPINKYKEEQEEVVKKILEKTQEIVEGKQAMLSNVFFVRLLSESVANGSPCILDLEDIKEMVISYGQQKSRHGKARWDSVLKQNSYLDEINVFSQGVYVEELKEKFIELIDNPKKARQTEVRITYKIL